MIYSLRQKMTDSSEIASTLEDKYEATLVKAVCKIMVLVLIGVKHQVSIFYCVWGKFEG